MEAEGYLIQYLFTCMFIIKDPVIPCVHRAARTVVGSPFVVEASGRGARVIGAILREVTGSCLICCHFWDMFKYMHLSQYCCKVQRRRMMATEMGNVYKRQLRLHKAETEHNW